MEEDGADLGAVLPDQRGLERRGRPTLRAGIKVARDGMESIAVRVRKSRGLMKESDVLGIWGVLTKSVSVEVKLRADEIPRAVPVVGIGRCGVVVSAVFVREGRSGIVGIMAREGFVWVALFGRSGRPFEQAIESVEEAKGGRIIAVWRIIA